MAPASSLQRPTALVIDDEQSVRWIIRRTLEPDVCDVVEAPDGVSGLQIISGALPR